MQPENWLRIRKLESQGLLNFYFLIQIISTIVGRGTVVSLSVFIFEGRDFDSRIFVLFCATSGVY
jgi:hypothetical protein